MRKIKYRVWCITNNQWEKDPCFMDRSGQLFEVKTGRFMDSKNHIIEQFTGLTDRNKKEIYEGDIIKVANGSVNGEIMYDTYPVELHPQFGLSHSLPLFLYDVNGNYRNDNGYRYCEVVGNIHENPVLVE